jgi:hypothetical protein
MKGLLKKFKPKQFPQIADIEPFFPQGCSFEQTYVSNGFYFKKTTGTSCGNREPSYASTTITVTYPDRTQVTCVASQGNTDAASCDGFIPLDAMNEYEFTCTQKRGVCTGTSTSASATTKPSKVNGEECASDSNCLSNVCSSLVDPVSKKVRKVCGRGNNDLCEVDGQCATLFCDTMNLNLGAYPPSTVGRCATPLKAFQRCTNHFNCMSGWCYKPPPSPTDPILPPPAGSYGFCHSRCSNGRPFPNTYAPPPDKLNFQQTLLDYFRGNASVPAYEDENCPLQKPCSSRVFNKNEKCPYMMRCGKSVTIFLYIHISCISLNYIHIINYLCPFYQPFLPCNQK